MSAATALQKRQHKWAATGVSSYPLTHPIVGQSSFFKQFEHFIHLVADEGEPFAHVFAIVAPWGIGKSRLAYELMSQINDTSPGWYVRDAAGRLTPARLFRDDADREKYLGLYVRYTQVANEHHNVDNWFGYGLFKALLPLAAAEFETSIQGQIAKEAYDRLLVLGFEAKKLAEALEVSQKHSDEILYQDPTLVTRLCQAAYAYLEQFGIKYILVALDELETAAEAVTLDTEPQVQNRLDGRTIKLIGKAIKEEDPRGKLPWLRYVALCSPAIGEELRAIQSTARRFELIELAQNSFADVSDFVGLLQADGRLSERYPPGLVEAAYAMSAGNFGWFNVVMANIDGVLAGRRARGAPADGTVGGLFDESLDVSSRMREYVLDRQAIAELNLPRDYLPAAKELLYGQLPLPLGRFNDGQRQALLSATNEYGEATAILYQRVEWGELECSRALRAGKFTRDRDEWRLTGVEERLDLSLLLANLATWSIHETSAATPGRRTLLVPLGASDFVQLVSLLYPHPAAEDAARALWRELVGAERVGDELATHLGPSIDMLGRLDLRYRKQGATALVFRDPDENTAHDQALAKLKGQSEADRARQILTGIMRTLDENWDYQPVETGVRGEAVTIATRVRTGAGDRGGLVTCDALRLHPESKLILAWVRQAEQLTNLCQRVSELFPTQGRIPVLAFTSSRALVDHYASPSSQVLKDAKDYLLLYQLTSREEMLLEPIGLAAKDCRGFQLHSQKFTTPFANRLQALLRPLRDAIGQWRRELDSRGRIAWPMRAGGVTKDEDRERVLAAYRRLLMKPAGKRGLVELDERDAIDVRELLDTLQRMRVSPRAKAVGYHDQERFGLFTTLDEQAEAACPAFLLRLYDQLLGSDNHEWTMPLAEREWFWGYVWEGARTAETYQQWMALACELLLAEEAAGEGRRADKRYRLVERARLRGELTEARNWLEGEYPVVVEKMKGVFGENKVNAYFASLDSPTPGTRTVEAKHRIDQALHDINRLDVEEAAWTGMAANEHAQDRFVACTQLRLDVRESIDLVYRADKYRALVYDESLRMLNFESDEVPLWERIGRARLFAEFVLDAQRRINERIHILSEEMHEQVQDLAGFPIQVFTLSLDKINGILAGSIGNEPPAGDTQRMQYLAPGTLGQALKGLRIWQAAEKLGQLAAEVGLNLQTGSEQALAEIGGTIVRSFFDLKKNYEQERVRLAEVARRLATLEAELDHAPDDFRYPDSLPELADLVARPELIETELTESLSEDIEGLISEHKPASRLGNFQPLMEAAKALLAGPRRALGNLSGQVLTLENAVQDYRRQLLACDELRQTEQAYNALLQTRGRPSEKPLDMADLERAGRLDRAKSLVVERCAAWSAEGEQYLGGTGVSFDLWKQIVARLNEGKAPPINGQQIGSLVEQGFLEVAYRLGGGQP